MKASARPRIAADTGEVMTLMIHQEQPAPWFTQTILSPDGTSTTITRHFRDGDEKRCQLCPAGRCVFKEVVGSCQIAVKGRVSIHEARMFDSTDLPWEIAH